MFVLKSMDNIKSYTPYVPGDGTQQTGAPLLPRRFEAASIGPSCVTNYKKALWPGKWDKDPLKWLHRYTKVWHYYGIYTPEQISREWNNPSKLLTFVIKAADTSSEEYMAKYVGLTDDWRTNVHQILARSLPPNRYAAALWDPRFDRDVGYALVPSTDDPQFIEKLAGDYVPSINRDYDRSEFVQRQL